MANGDELITSVGKNANDTAALTQTAPLTPQIQRIQTAHPALMLPLQTEIQQFLPKVRLLPKVKPPLRQVQTETAVVAAIIPVLPEIIQQNCFYRNKKEKTI